jgi:hypothetical protein
MNLRAIKRGILCFWAFWMVLVFTTNIADGLKQLHLLPTSSAFASGNYVLMMKVTSVYQKPAWIVILLFCGVILWEALGTWSHGHAALCVGGSSSHSIIQRAFAINLALWATFMIADEVFLAYGLENVHRSIFAAQLLSLLAISLLPESNQG